MATATNVMTTGFRGKFGNDMVFRTMRGKTFVSPPARKPAKKKESEAQHNTRSTFRKATEWAQAVLEHPEKKAYYQQRAKALKLPNAYTAAITDYMRKARVIKTEHRGTTTYKINKPGFSLKNVAVRASEPIGTFPQKVEVRQHKDTWFVHYTPINGTTLSLTLIMTDNFRRESQFIDVPI